MSEERGSGERGRWSSRRKTEVVLRVPPTHQPSASMTRPACTRIALMVASSRS
jgi:hypothetical protein